MLGDTSASSVTVAMSSSLLSWRLMKWSILKPSSSMAGSVSTSASVIRCNANGFYPFTADISEKRHNVPKECS